MNFWLDNHFRKSELICPTGKMPPAARRFRRPTREQIPSSALIVNASNREASMKMAKITLAGLAALTVLSSASLAQQGMTGTVTRIDRLDGTVSIQLQKPQNQGGTVGANTGAPEELKTKVQGNLLNTLHAGDRVKFSITDTAGAKTVANLERE
jgi:hypothetical protein